MRRRTPEIPCLPDRYELVRTIAQTPYGDVVEAINRDRNHLRVALKLLRAEGSRAGVARTMFQREVEALRGLNHPAIVQILDAFECEDGLLVIELELVPGGHSLSGLFEDVRTGRTAAPSPEWRLRMATRLADAVIEAHRRKVIHRDIKPSNVLWHRQDDLLKLADFGIAAVIPLTVRDPSGMTLRSFYTRPFASPEQMLQKAASTPSDVYGFGLLVAALLAMSEPTEDFEREQLGALIAPAFDELRAEGLPQPDIDELKTTLEDALHEDPSARPSLMQIREVIKGLQASLVPRPQAAIVLTHKAQEGLAAAGFSAEGRIVEDFNTDLCVQLERTDRGERIKIFGATLFAVLATDAHDPDQLCAVDAGQNPGPTHASHRRSARSCPVRIRLARGSARPLVAFAHDADREATRRATSEIVDRARLILQIEQERLPVFALEAIVQGGQPVRNRREARIGRASGYTGSQTEKVDVNGGFRLTVQEARVLPRSLVKNLVRQRLQGRGVDFDEEVFDDTPETDWYSLFDDPRDIDVFDEHDHMIGKVVRYDRNTSTLHVQTDKKRRLLRAGSFFVRNQQKEGQLRKQEQAIDTLDRGESVRADMATVLAESSAHRMGEKPWIHLLQPGLKPEARVKDLVNRILASESAFCLQGPPGTGKTTIIAETVAQLLELEPRSRILLCSQANDAVANAIERLLALREQLGRDWIIVRDVRKARAQQEGRWSGKAAAYRKFTRRILQGTRDHNLGPIAGEAIDEWAQCVQNKTRQVERDYNGLVQVWGATTARSTRPLRDLDGEAYDLVIIDEAAKATVGEVLVPIVHAKRLLMVGDQKQLPPFLEDTTAQALQELGISKEEATYSLFEHLYELVPRDHRDMLDVQFRMHPSIGDVVSQLFYEGKVRNGPGTDKRRLPAGRFDRDHRVLWVDVVGRDYKVGKTSRANDRERTQIGRVLDRLDEDARKAGVTLEVAVIAAYRGQADKLQADLERTPHRYKALKVKAATVDAFQGREADVVLYSLVRTGDAERKFIADGRRFNVALSRARSLLVMIGDKSGARGTARLQQLLEMIPEENQLEESAFDPPTGFGQLAAAFEGLQRPQPLSSQPREEEPTS